MRLGSFVYFIGCNWGNSSQLRVKIGFTSRHPLERAGDFQPGSPGELDVLFYMPGDMGLERKFHATFAPCRIHNEWFHPYGLMDRFVRRLMRDGNGARSPTDFALVQLAMFEEVYDWAPSPHVDEDFIELEQSADREHWDDDFAYILAERLAKFRAKQAEAA